MIEILNPIFVLFFSLLHYHYYLNIQTTNPLHTYCQILSGTIQVEC